MRPEKLSTSAEAEGLEVPVDKVTGQSLLDHSKRPKTKKMRRRKLGRFAEAEGLDVPEREVTGQSLFFCQKPKRKSTTF